QCQLLTGARSPPRAAAGTVTGTDIERAIEYDIKGKITFTTVHGLVGDSACSSKGDSGGPWLVPSGITEVAAERIDIAGSGCPSALPTPSRFRRLQRTRE